MTDRPLLSLDYPTVHKVDSTSILMGGNWNILDCTDSGSVAQKAGSKELQGRMVMIVVLYFVVKNATAIRRNLFYVFPAVVL